MLLALCLVSCGKQEARTILPEGCGLKAGDVVFRRSGGLSSHAMVKMKIEYGDGSAWITTKP